MVKLSLPLAIFFLMTWPTAAQETAIALVRTITLAGVEGRIDHLAFDGSSGRLFVAALGNNTVEVLDVQAARRIRSLRLFQEPQGIAVALEAGVVAVANGEGEGLRLLAAGGGNDPVGTVRLGDDADNVRYDPAAKRLYVGFGNGALAAVDPARRQVLGQAPLAGHPESFQLERSGPRIFVNVPVAREIAVVDRGAMKVTAIWPMTAARSNYPMALDEPGHRLFLGCRSPAKVLLYDTNTGKVLASFQIVGDTDDLFYDPARRRLYVTGGEGFLDVLEERGSNRFERVVHLPTSPGARTSLFVPELNRLYVAVPHRGTQAAEVREYAVQ